MAKQKYYVVWDGLNPGIYSSWHDCLSQVKGYEGAKYKSFDSQEEAKQIQPKIFILDEDNKIGQRL